ncbi:MAG: hypothetical protein V3R41_04465 [Gammaproteobacteria bacterium]
MASTEGLIVLPSFRFPDHIKVAEWLNATQYGEEYELVIAQAELEGYRTKKIITCSALEPKSGQKKFLFELQGAEGLTKLAQEMEQKILDFHKK